MARGLLVLAFTASVGSIANADQPVAGRDCGAYCLEVVSQLLGDSPRSQTECRQAVGSVATGLCSLLDVANALGEREFEVEVVDPVDKPPLSVSIAAVRFATDGPVHFIVIEPTNGGRLLVYNVPAAVQALPWGSIREVLYGPLLEVRARRKRIQWMPMAATVAASLLLAFAGARRALRSDARSGLVLAVMGCVLLGCEPQPRLELPGGDPSGVEVLPAGYIDLGELPSGNQFATVSLRNRGESDLRIKEISSSCGCAVVNEDALGELSAGETRDCRIRITVAPGASKLAIVTFQFEGGLDVRAAIAFRGRRLAGLEYTKHKVLTGVVPRIPAEFELSIEVPNGASQVYWDSGSRAVALIESRRDPLVGERSRLIGRFRLRVEQPGPGAVTVIGTVDGVPHEFLVSWSADYPIPINPSIVRLTKVGDGYGGELALGSARGWAYVGAIPDQDEIQMEEVTSGAVRSLAIRVEPRWVRTKGLGAVLVTVRGEDDRELILEIPIVALPSSK